MLILVIAGVAVSITLGSRYVGGVVGASIAEYSYDKIKSVL